MNCADNDGHNTDAIDALTLTIPTTIRFADSLPEIRHSYVLSILQATRKSSTLGRFAVVFSDLLCAVLFGTPLSEAVEQAGRDIYGSSYSVRKQVDSSSGDPMVACYIDSSFAALLFFAAKYADSTEAALLSSANAGGENVARGAALGALLGAAHGYSSGFPDWMKEGLFNGVDIVDDIDRLVSASMTVC